MIVDLSHVFHEECPASAAAFPVRAFAEVHE
jgi:hypothetical protein